MRIKQLPVLLLFYFALFSTPSEAQNNIEYSVYFRTGNYDLSLSSKVDLKRIVDSMAATNKKFSIAVIGGADNKGSDSFNYRLSQQRAVSVKEFLVTSGFDENNIITEFNGETLPVASNETENGRRLNRRADIVIQQVSISHAIEKIIPPDNVPEGDIGGLYSLLKTPPQEYCIDLARDTFLVGKKGTILHYKANTIKRDQLSCKCFTLQLNEFFDKTDLIFNNLTTTADGNLLESGGMIKLDGYCDGKKYELKPGEFFTVMVPTDTVLPGMKLLSANRNDDSEYLNWKLDPDNAVLDDFDWQRMLIVCGFWEGQFAGANCPFFFCRIRDFFRGLFGGGRKYKNSDVRNNNESAKEQALLKKYELKGEDLAVALQKSKDNTGKDALKYYVYKNSNWDYRNIDRYKPGTKFINFIVDNKPGKETDVKLVFKISKTVVPCLERGASYIFKNINDDADVWVIGLRYTVNKEIYLGLKEINTSEQRTTLDFKPVSVEELKSIMQKINK